MKFTQILLGIAMAGMVVYAFVCPDAAGFREPKLARIIFFHLPCALIAPGLVFFNAWLGGRYLAKRDLRLDVRLAASSELATVFSILTLATGIIFSYAQWGAWWQNDARQTSFAFVVLLVVAAQAIRAGFADENRRALASAAYAVASAIPAIFLIFVFPRLSQVQQASMHPSQTLSSGSLDAWYGFGVIGILILLSFVAASLYRDRVAVGLAQLEREQNDGYNPDSRGGAAPTGVVRPVAVHEEHES